MGWGNLPPGYEDWSAEKQQAWLDAQKAGIWFDDEEPADEPPVGDQPAPPDPPEEDLWWDDTPFPPDDDPFGDYLDEQAPPVDDSDIQDILTPGRNRPVIAAIVNINIR